MLWNQLPIVAFDTETTGLDPFGGDRVMEVAFVVLRTDANGRVASAEPHVHLVDPGIPIPRKVTEITGLTDADVQGKPPFSAIAAEVAELLGSGIAVAHNLPFDVAFLRRELEAAGVPWREPIASIDTVDLSMRLYGEVKGHKLSDVVKRLDIELTEAHRARNDAEACGRAFLEMARRHDAPAELEALLDWADAIGQPPIDGPFGVDAWGVPVLAFGEHEGEAVWEHPTLLAWVSKARVRRNDGWDWRFPESARRWADRYLRIRTAGRMVQGSKSFRAADWTLDPCLHDARMRPL